MTGVQVFKWFCKEQKIMPLIRELYYEVRPTDNSWKMPPKYIGLEEYIQRMIESNGFFDLLLRFENSYYYKVGWNKFDYFRKKHGIENILRKWDYFLKNNLQICEDTFKVGDTVLVRNHYWFTVNDADAAQNIKTGKILSINIGKYTAIVEQDDLGRREVFLNDIVKEGTIESVDINFYIKRNRKTYYGANRK